MSPSAAEPPTTGTSVGQALLGFVWPFPTESASQYQRVDQGWDLQEAAGAPVEAVAAGVIGQANPDPGGFGNNYPFETLFNPPAGAPSNTVYYGHIHVIPSLVGQTVAAGQVIGYTNTTPGQQGSGAPPGWLEIGFAQPGTGAPVQRGSESVATQAGQTMKNFLLGAPTATGAGLDIALLPPGGVGALGNEPGNFAANPAGQLGAAASGVASDATSAFGAALGALLGPFESWALRMFIGLAGAALVVAALILAAKDSDLAEHPGRDAAMAAVAE